MIVHYIKVALRNLMKHRVHSFISALCLALGIMVFSVVCLFVSRFVFSGRPASNEVRVSVEEYGGEDTDNVSYFMRAEIFRDMQRACSGIVDTLVASSFTRNAEIEVSSSDGSVQPYEIVYKTVGGAYFSYTRMPMLYGTRLPVKPDEVVITSSFAERLGKDVNPVGMTVRLTDGNGVYEIVNVADDSSDFNREKVDCLFPPEMAPEMELMCMAVIGRWQTIDDVNRQLSSVRWTSGGRLYGAGVVRQADDSTFVGFLIAFISSLVLVSAVFSFLRFTFQEFRMRSREMALRRFLGEERKGLFGLLSAEVACMFVFSCFLSLVLTEIFVPLLGELLPDSRWLDVWSCVEVEAVVLLVMLAAGCVLSYVQVQNVCRDGRLSAKVSGGGRHGFFRNAVLWLQVAVSVFFLSAVFAVYLTLNETFGGRYMPLSDADEERTLVVECSSERMAENLQTICRAVQGVRGVQETLCVGDASLSPVHGAVMRHVRADSSAVVFRAATGDSTYFSFFGIPMRSTGVDIGGPDDVYIDRHVEKMLRDDGQWSGRIELDGKMYRIAGVLEGLYNNAPISGKYGGSVFFVSPSDARTMLLKVAEGEDVGEVSREVEKVVRRYVPPTLDVDIIRLSLLRDADISVPVMLGRVLACVSAVSLLLVVLSIWTSVSLDAACRQKEVALRKVNGASPWSIARLFGRSYLWIFLTAFVPVHIFSRFLLIRLMEGSSAQAVYGWGWSVAVFLTLAVAVALSLAWQIWRLMRLNPADVLRKE